MAKANDLVPGKTERELREDAERFHDLAESVQEVFWVASATLQDVLYVSPAYERVWGRPLASAYGSTAAWLTAIHPEDRALVQEALARWAEGEYALDYRIVRPDGAVRWINARGAAVRDENGTVQRVVGIAEDITTRKEHEEELRYLAEASRILASSLDYEETLARVARLAVPEIADWCAVYVAEEDELRIVEVAHRDPEKIAIAWEFRRRYPPDPAAPTGAYRVMKTGEPELIPEISPSVIEAFAPDEEFIRLIKELGLRSAMTVPMSARGRTLGVISFIAAESGRRFGPQDLEFAETLAARAALAIDNARLYRAVNDARGEAERRAREEAALRDAAAALSTSFTVEDVIRQISGSAVTATNSDGAFIQQIDLRGGVVEVVAVSGAITPRVGSKFPYEGSYVERVVETKQTEVIGRLADSERPLPDELAERYPDSSALVVPLVDAGEPIGALFLVRLPERWYFRADEVERALTFGDLAALAFRKVHILEESERRREELEQVIESRARLMRGFSHDLKNPLGAADGLLQLIEDGILDPSTPRAHDAIGRARRALRSAFRLIDDLLELARAEAGEVEIRLHSTDVRAAARELAEEYRAQAEAEGLQLEVQLSKEIPLIASDVARVRQILGNLLSNAVKYTPSGGTVTVCVDERERPDQPGSAWVIVEVRDTGPGIPKDQQHYIFREFTRLERGADKSGAGIGLAISKRLALALGGDLTLDSEAGTGARFTLWLPRQHEDIATRKSA